MQTITPSSVLSTSDVAMHEHPVRIAVLVLRRDKVQADAVKVTGPVRTAVRAAFAHPKLAAALQTLQMDADRLTGRIVSRWASPGHEDGAQQLWEKSDGSVKVCWWVDRDDSLAPEVKPA